MIVNNDAPEIIKKLLEKDHSILIGSRGLGVNDDISDYDIAVLDSECIDITADYLKHAVKDYFSVLPLNNMSLIRIKDTIPNIDILIYKEVKDILVVWKVMNDLSRVPKYLLKDKYNRVVLFETALLHYGFKKVPDDNDRIMLDSRNVDDLPIYSSSTGIDIGDDLPF